MHIPLSLDTAPLDVPLWAIYGSDCFPTIFACRVKAYPEERFLSSVLPARRAIWGWSVYRRVGGFRTLGVGNEWCEKNNVRIFRSRQEAFDYIITLFPPDGTA